MKPKPFTLCSRKSTIFFGLSIEFYSENIFNPAQPQIYKGLYCTQNLPSSTRIKFISAIVCRKNGNQ